MDQTRMTENRNREFIRRCIDIFERDCREATVQSLESVLDRALARQPCCHYVGYDLASRKLHLIERRGLENVVKEELAREKWREIRRQVDDVLAQNPRKTFDMALSFVLNFCRPSRFYMSRDTARRLITPHLCYHLSRRPVAPAIS